MVKGQIYDAGCVKDDQELVTGYRLMALSKGLKLAIRGQKLVSNDAGVRHSS